MLDQATIVSAETLCGRTCPEGRVGPQICYHGTQLRGKALHNRIELIMSGVEKQNTRGIEIGPSMNPLAPKREGWNTIIVDFADTETLRSIARERTYPNNPQLADAIEEVDLVWQGGSLKSALEAHNLSQLDFFVSSHNIEHSVDIIDHLQAAENVIHADGVIAMAIPDMRYTFDFFRNPITVAEALRVHRLKPKYHESEYLLDQQINALLNNSQGCWTTHTALQDLSLGSDPMAAWNQYVQPPTPASYNDCHRWCFVPASFELLIFDLNWMGLLNLCISRLSTAESGVLGSEFIVQLKKTNNDASASGRTWQEINKKRLGLQLKVLQQLSERLRIPYLHYMQ